MHFSPCILWYARVYHISSPRIRKYFLYRDARRLKTVSLRKVEFFLRKCQSEMHKRQEMNITTVHYLGKRIKTAKSSNSNTSWLLMLAMKFRCKHDYLFRFFSPFNKQKKNCAETRNECFSERRVEEMEHWGSYDRGTGMKNFATASITINLLPDETFMNLFERWEAKLILIYR